MPRLIPGDSPALPDEHHPSHPLILPSLLYLEFTQVLQVTSTESPPVPNYGTFCIPLPVFVAPR